MYITIPSFIESLYSMKIYRYINSPLSLITGLLPLSLAEVSIYCISILIFYKLILFIRKIFQIPKNILNHIYLLKILKKLICFAVILYFSFLTLWGLNYYRISFSETSGIKTTQYSKDDLEELCLHLIKESNAIREIVDENNEGIMTISKGKKWVLENAYIGYDIISKTYSTLSGKYGSPKPVMLSELMCYTGIAGIYYPFTGEANININVPYSSLPNIVTHEMAHQRGYAREDEANFIAYLACIYNPYPEFKYSGVLLALTHSINALYKEDLESFEKLKTYFSEGLSRDLSYINYFWKKYEGPVERVSTNINNAYLKANNQKDGIKSYGRMVDLLIAYHKGKL